MAARRVLLVTMVRAVLDTLVGYAVTYHHACHSDVAPQRQLPDWAAQEPPCRFWADEGCWREEGRHCIGCTRGPARSSND